MQEYPETAAYRRGYAACRAELEGRVVAWLEAQGMAFEAMLDACVDAQAGFEELAGYLRRHGDNPELAIARGKQCQEAIAKAKKGEA